MIEASTIVAYSKSILLLLGFCPPCPSRDTRGYRPSRGAWWRYQASGITEISTVVSEACIAKNELHRHGGYSPSQWVLGKMPDTPPSVLSEQPWADLGAIEDQCDPESKFTLVHEARAAAKRAYVHLDCNKKFKRLCYAMHSTLFGTCPNWRCNRLTATLTL